MIRHFSISNFKSLGNFSMPMGKFNCLIGLNGSGKSTVLQALDFLAHVMTGEVDAWLQAREWDSRDLTCRPLSKRGILFAIRLDFPSLGTVTWGGGYNPVRHRCTAEIVKTPRNDAEILRVKKGEYRTIDGNGVTDRKEISFEYQGSILSRLKTDNPHLLATKKFFSELKSLELLAPHLMRIRAQTAQDIGTGGEKLAAFLYTLPRESHAQIVATLQKFHPNLLDLHIINQKFGWKKLFISEQTEERPIGTLLPIPMTTEARHINDGLLRQLAIIAQTHSKHSFLLFDEIENGMNQEIIGQLLNTLLEARQQIVVTTHSPQILNFLSDNVAKESVIFLYKTPQGLTRARRFFDLPTAAKKLEVLGPGEVYADTNLETLVQEALAMDNNQPTDTI
ncbi:MAG: AAA family ATPase [Magnetococcus sp. YQC-3]